MLEVSKQELRDLVADAIEGSIDLRRASLEVNGQGVQPTGPPTEEEIDDFLFDNPFLDPEDIEQLVEPGLLGFLASTARLNVDVLTAFLNHCKDWSQNESWLGGDNTFSQYDWRFDVDDGNELRSGTGEINFLKLPDSSKTWKGDVPQPGWLRMYPPIFLKALDAMREMGGLHHLEWRDFEVLLGELLEMEGWHVLVTEPSKDGGIDVIASKHCDGLGLVKSVWQAKKYHPNNKVQLSDVRELSAIRDSEKATRGVMATTSSLTSGAIDWIARDEYRLQSMNSEDIQSWIRRLS